MQINSLYIKEYKLLKEFNIDFKEDVSIFIGINGSGKSTILECIAIIFSDLFLKERSKFGYSLEYELRLEEILEQTATTSDFKTEYVKVQIEAKNAGEDSVVKVLLDSKEIIKESEIEKQFGFFEKILPSNIVIYYSGLAEIMKKICLPHDEKLSVNYRKGNTSIERPFFYFEPPLFNLILITLLSYEFGNIPSFLKSRVKIHGLQSIQLTIKKPSWGKGKSRNWWGAKGEVKQFLDLLNSKSDNNLLIDDLLKNADEKNGNIVIESNLNDDNLIITIITQEKLFEIREHFVEEKTLFKVLNTLIIDGFNPEVKFVFINESGKHFNVISEGEQQAIIVRGLIELVNNENTLFLFDEPDTYLHPSWQIDFIGDLIDSNNKDEFSTSQFLITTHSPQLVSNLKEGELFIMKDGGLINHSDDYYGRDINSILSNYMGSEYRPEEVTEIIEKISILIDEKKYKEAKSKLDLLNKNDSEYIRLSTKLKFLLS